jgi:hypothetical protein
MAARSGRADADRSIGPSSGRLLLQRISGAVVASGSPADIEAPRIGRPERNDTAMPNLIQETEREPWGGVVAIADTERGRDQPGYYALVRAIDWCAGPDEMPIWRGPAQPYELVPKERLIEVSCRTILVDERGFYTCIPIEGDPVFYRCPQITEELLDLVRTEAETLFEVEANGRAAEAWSNVTDELSDDYAGEVWVMATFGDAVAVNGEIERRRVTPPRGWVETDRGGWLSGEEGEIEKEWLADPISRVLSEKLKTKIDPWLVGRIVDQLWPKRWIYWNSACGDTEVWVSKRAMRRYEKEQERLNKEREDKRVRAAVEARQRAEEERREKIRRGGWPEPKEWSPRGKMPGER